MSWTAIVSGVSYVLPNGRELLKNLNFSLDTRLSALVGPNGIGKTCLAKLVAGHIEPTEGIVRRTGSFKLLPQLQEPEPVTVAEFLSTEYEWSVVGERLLGSIDRRSACTTLSGGQWMRVRLACALENQFLILDEPTNNLDRQARESLNRFLRERTGGTLLISHDRECLQLCEQIFELSNRGLVKFGGGWSAYTEAAKKERGRLSAALEQAKRERDTVIVHQTYKGVQQDKRNRRGVKTAAAGGLPKIVAGARKRRAQVTSGKLDADTLERSTRAIQQAHEALNDIKIEPVIYAGLVGREIPAQKLVAEASGFNVRFKDWIYRKDLEFTWRGNVRIALKGGNGSGKSTLLKAILGNPFESRGELRRGDLITLYLDQGCACLEDHRTVFDNVRSVSSASDSEIRNDLAKLLFLKDSIFQKAGELSGGERLRAALAKSLLGTKKPELIVLDEPTNNLDLVNVEFLERIVRDFQGALIVVSHDDSFLENCGISQELVV